MSLDYIRTAYNVPARKGQRVRYTGDKGPAAKPREGTITGADGQYLKIRMDGDSFTNNYHPTWEIEYLDSAADNTGAVTVLSGGQTGAPKVSRDTPENLRRRLHGAA